jgi:hypothetical protein
MNYSKKELENLYRTLSNKELAGLLGISTKTLHSIIKEHKIELKGKGNRKKRFNLTITN